MKEVKLSKDARAVWQYVAQEIDRIDETMRPLRESVKYLRENGQL